MGAAAYNNLPAIGIPILQKYVFIFSILIFANYFTISCISSNHRFIDLLLRFFISIYVFFINIIIYVFFINILLHIYLFFFVVACCLEFTFFKVKKWGVWGSNPSPYI